MRYKTKILNSNLKIIDVNNKSEWCYIFCTSNAEATHNSNKFEWENISSDRRIVKSANKMIFIKDDTLCYYTNGISTEINSIKKLIIFLKKETNKLKIKLVGNSAGGYLAMLLSCFLPNVERAVSFGGIINIYKWTGTNSDFTFDQVTRLTNLVKEKKETYFNLVPFINKYKPRIFHFYASNCKSDLIELDCCKNITNL